MNGSELWSCWIMRLNVAGKLPNPNEFSSHHFSPVCHVGQI